MFLISVIFATNVNR